VSRAARQVEPEADSAPAPPREEEQYVFVRRDGSLVSLSPIHGSGTLRYITPDGLRRSIGRDALDIEATQQFNEQRGVNFAPRRNLLFAGAGITFSAGLNRCTGDASRNKLARFF